MFRVVLIPCVMTWRIAQDFPVGPSALSFPRLAGVYPRRTHGDNVPFCRWRLSVKPRIIFPSDPLSPAGVDPHFEREREAAEREGFRTGLVNYEDLLAGEIGRCLRRVPEAGAGEQILLRGWMVPPETYAHLHAALENRGYHPLTAPGEYRHAHLLPENYPVLEGRTPRSVWVAVPGADEWTAVFRSLEGFGTKPIVLKDYVKSRKHEWEEACFIPEATDVDRVRRTVERFIELQGDQLYGGLVFREYVPLASLGTHPKSGMPLTEEYRCFILKGRIFYSMPYWDVVDYGSGLAPVALFEDLARRVRSSFFTLDIARTAEGDWTIIELGDAQVAGLPGTPDAFYASLAEEWDRIHS